MSRRAPILRRLDELVEEWCDPQRHCVDLAVKFREVDRLRGSDRIVPTGRVSRIYGGRYDRYLPSGDGTVGAYRPDVDPDELERVVLDCNPAQFAILCDDVSQHVLAFGSRGASKSELLARWVAKQSVLWPKRMLAAMVQKHVKARRLLRRKIVPLLPYSWRRDVRYTPGDTVIELVSMLAVAFYSGAALDDAIGDNTVAIAVDERQSMPSENVDSAFLTMREAGRDFRSLEVGTLRAGEFEDYVEKCRQNPTYAVHELSITDNIHLAHEFDADYGCEVPAIVRSARRRMDPLLFEQEIGKWDARTQRFRCVAAHDTDRILWPFERKSHVEPYRTTIAKATVQRRADDISPTTGDDATETVLHQRLQTRHRTVVGVHLDYSPFAAVALRVYRTPKGWPPLAWAIGEIALDGEGDATRLGQAIIKRWGSDVVVIADAAGHQGVGGKSAIAELRALGLEVRARRRNPPDEDLFSAVRGKLLNADRRVSLLVDAACERLVDGCLNFRLTKTRKPQVMENGNHHLVYALAYAVHMLFPISLVAEGAAGRG